MTEPRYTYDITFYPMTQKYVWTIWGNGRGKYILGGSCDSMSNATSVALAHIAAIEHVEDIS